MDENSKNQSKISKLVDKGAIKITGKNKDMLSPSQLKRYEDARQEQNIVYFKPRGNGGRFMNLILKQKPLLENHLWYQG